IAWGGGGCASLLPIHGEKVSARIKSRIDSGGRGRASADSALFPRKRGEGGLRVSLELNVPGIFRRKLRPADERRAVGRGPFGGRLAIRGLGKAPAGGGEGPMIGVEFAHDPDHPVDRL